MNRGFYREKNNYVEIIIMSLLITTVLGATFSLINILLAMTISFGIAFNLIIAVILGRKIRDKSYFNNQNMGIIAIVFTLYSMVVMNFVHALLYFKNFQIALSALPLYFRYISIIDVVFMLLSCYVAYRTTTT